MSAGKDAEPLGAENWLDENGKPMTLEQAAEVLPGVECECGWSGILCELLCEEDESTLWCPQCRTAGWIYI